MNAPVTDTGEDVEDDVRKTLQFKPITITQLVISLDMKKTLLGMSKNLHEHLTYDIRLMAYDSMTNNHF